MTGEKVADVESIGREGLGIILEVIGLILFFFLYSNSMNWALSTYGPIPSIQSGLFAASLIVVVSFCSVALALIVAKRKKDERPGKHQLASRAATFLVFYFLLYGGIIATFLFYDYTTSVSWAGYRLSPESASLLGCILAVVTVSVSSAGAVMWGFLRSREDPTFVEVARTDGGKR